MTNGQKFQKVFPNTTANPNAFGQMFVLVSGKFDCYVDKEWWYAEYEGNTKKKVKKSKKPS